MRFESLESRILFDQALNAAIENDTDLIGSATPAITSITIDISETETNVDEFRWFSDEISQATIDELMAATQDWNDNLPVIGLFQFDESSLWYKTPYAQSMTVSDEGYLIAQRRESDADRHTILLIRKSTGVSQSFIRGGRYLQQDHHYFMSFDVRFPETEASWLANHSGAIVMQLWGPKDEGEEALHPPFAIHTMTLDGEPSWRVQSRGDSRLITPIGTYESYLVAHTPLGPLGEWQHWDIEYVPNPFGDGLIRTWLNGTLIAEWTDIKSSYRAVYQDAPIGPLNPGFGLYAPLAEDGMEVHLDNILIKSDGAFQRSISGVVSSTDSPVGHLITSVNNETGETYSTTSGPFGVYSLPVPAGQYTVTARHSLSGENSVIRQVDLRSESSILVNLDISESPLTVLVGDVNGDGVDDIITRRSDDGSWWVTQATSEQPITSNQWGSWSISTAWQNVQVGDFNGDGLDDVVGRAGDGAWWVARSDGNRFHNERFGGWSTDLNWLDVNVGDVDGDGRADIVGRLNGTWWVAHSDGSRFKNERWGYWSPAVSWQDVHIADVDGDGRSDLVGRAAADGKWWVAHSNGTQFVNEIWGRWSAAINWQYVHIVDVNGDGRSDVVGRNPADGAWWVARSQGTKFSNENWGRWPAIASWLDEIIVDLDGELLSDKRSGARASGSASVTNSGGNSNGYSRSWSAANG